MNRSRQFFTFHFFFSCNAVDFILVQSLLKHLRCGDVQSIPVFLLHV